MDIKFNPNELVKRVDDYAKSVGVTDLTNDYIIYYTDLVGLQGYKDPWLFNTYYDFLDELWYQMTDKEKQYVRKVCL